ncbi:MAG: primosomal protein N' [Clostridia bacterium]|nr:primosomal protein N' [Clostridia bacterium]
MEYILALVAVENVAYHFDLLYSYIIPDELKCKVKTGSRVIVGFGRSKKNQRQGIVFGFDKTDNNKGLKCVQYVVEDEDSVISDEMLSVACFLKERTFCTYFDAVKAQIPAGFNYNTKALYLAKHSDDLSGLTADEIQVYQYLCSFDSPVPSSTVFSKLGFSADSDIIERLTAKNLVMKSFNAVKNIGEATNRSVRLTVDDADYDEIYEKLTAKQRECVKALRDIGSCTLKELCYFTGVTSSVINTLNKKGIISIYDAVYYRIPEIALSDDKLDEEIVLSAEQQKAFDELNEKLKFGGVSLLYGITGSGKTSVFLSLIDRVISQGKQVIVMVPEISLTPQMMAIFKSRYGDNVAIFHSALSAGERRDEYKRVRDGLVQIALGTRSAVFAPFSDIGLIVIDEEQEHTYKSESSPRYHTVDVARFRANNHNALLLLSSATPSVNSFSYAKHGKYSLHTLTERYGAAVLPDVELIDMKQERKAGNRYNISSKLLEMLENNLENKKQSILLINRRGYNTFAACDSCGSVINCPSCSISLTYHAANNRLMCHYCGYSKPFTSVCSECGKSDVRYAGYGTQKIEQEIAELLPEARVLRMDTDSISSRFSFEKGLSDFGDGSYDILLGTQMVAKGLNFENVTLVGVINADQQLNNDDFRSEERTFDLLTQVVGRSGRGAFKGVAVIQTLTPENHIIQFAQRQDFESFYNSEIVIRKALVYPPYCDLCVMTFSSEKEVSALNCSREFLSELENKLKNDYKETKVIILGPMPPRISKISNKYRYRIIIKCKNNKKFRSLVSELLIQFGKNSRFADVTLTADINPENLM